MKEVTAAITGWILLASFVASAQGQAYKAGFKSIRTYDSSRTYKPDVVSSDKLHYRPVDIDLWYPAEITSSDTTASFSDLVNLLEQRSNFYDDTRTYNGLTDEVVQYLCAGIGCTDYKALKRIKTESYVRAMPVDEPFPLIIYLCGFNGMSYENYLLFESLVKKGFVVASVGSVGRYPGNMSMEPEDLFAQIKDAEFIADYLSKRNLVSGDIGLVGYSWGGLAATIMAMSDSRRFKAVVSLDGSEQFTYVDEEENEKLNVIRRSDFFRPQAINLSFLYLDSDIATWDNPPDSIYNITDFIQGDKWYLKIDSSTHEDFSSVSVLEKSQNESRYHVVQQLTVNYLLEQIKRKNTFHENIPVRGITRQFSQPARSAPLATADKKILKGIVRDEKTNLPLSYVNVGILNKDVGTISNIKGEFELPWVMSNVNDTLRISMVGYEPLVVHMKDVFKRQMLKIKLKETESELKEIVITDKRLKTKVLGNKTESKFFGGKFASGDLGSEIAIRMRVKDAPAYLDTFSFNISYNAGDTASFRVNIYDVRNGLPDKNILAENIVLTMKGQTGKIDVDLSPYNLVANDDFFIGLEWIEGDNNSGIVFSAGFANKGTYYRKASQGRWRKHAMGVGFNITVKY